MNRKGFVLLETVIVVVVVVVSMLGLYTTYAYVFTNLKQSKKYDNINDLYKLNIFYNLMKEKGFPNDEILIINSGNCTSYFDNNCSDLMNNELKIDYFIYTNKNLNNILNNRPASLKNTDINYIKLLEQNFSYLIAVYSKDDEYYYVSMKVGEL